jgi:hypothetical protein
VRFNALAIFLTPRFSLAIDFNVRTSSLVQRRITFFFLANFGSFFVNRASSTPTQFINTAHFAARNSMLTPDIAGRFSEAITIAITRVRAIFAEWPAVVATTPTERRDKNIFHVP